MTEQPTRVLLVDDEDIVRMGLRLVLEGDPTLAVVGEAADGQQALSAVRLTHPNLVLLDIRMPRMDGLATLRALRTDHPDLPVVMLTTFDTDDMVLTALRDGAAGFLLKSTPPQELLAALHDVLAGRPTLSPSVTGQLIAAVGRQPTPAAVNSARQLFGELTEREADVARAIAEGRSNADIAEHLFMSVGTVKTHITHILDKLSLDNRVQIALLVRDAEG
jgi:Response regulator containing a CheY-like receiver domain and an HTH DNA-binding domain